LSIFGHVRRLQESVPAHEALHLAVNTCAGQRPDDRPDWKRPRGRPRRTWIRQLEVDVELTADAVLGTWPVIVKSTWRAQRPVAGQATFDGCILLGYYAISVTDSNIVIFSSDNGNAPEQWRLLKAYEKLAVSLLK